MDRSYTPKERLHFYRFITAREEWDMLRQIIKDLGWDNNKVRQFNRIRAYWEGRSSQKRQGGNTVYMDELINEYFKRKGFDPSIIAFGENDASPNAEQRLATDKWEDIKNYGEGTLFIEGEEAYTSAFAEIVINENGTLEVVVGDSNPAEK